MVPFMLGVVIGALFSGWLTYISPEKSVSLWNELFNFKNE